MSQLNPDDGYLLRVVLSDIFVKKTASLDPGAKIHMSNLSKRLGQLDPAFHKVIKGKTSQSQWNLAEREEAWSQFLIHMESSPEGTHAIFSDSKVKDLIDNPMIVLGDDAPQKVPNRLAEERVP